MSEVPVTVGEEAEVVIVFLAVVRPGPFAPRLLRSPDHRFTLPVPCRLCNRCGRDRGESCGGSRGRVLGSETP
jgi:hypothetical protein